MMSFTCAQKIAHAPGTPRALARSRSVPAASALDVVLTARASGAKHPAASPLNVMQPGAQVRAAGRQRAGGPRDTPARGAALASATAPPAQADEEQPFIVERNIDRRPDRQFLSDINDTNTVEGWKALVNGRDLGRSATELGAALFALRRIHRDLNIEVSKPTAKALQKYVALLKSNMDTIPPRSIANSVSAIVNLKQADKDLLVKMASAVEKLIAEDPTCFKLVELSQVCWACKALNFRSTRLMNAISLSIRCAAFDCINPTSLSLLFTYIPQLEYYDEKLLKFMLDKMVDMRDMLSISDCISAFLGCARLQYLQGAPQFRRLQEVVCKQKPGRISRKNTLQLLISLLHLQALEPTTAAFLQTNLTESTSEPWRAEQLAMLSAIIESLRIQGHIVQDNITPELIEASRASAAQQEIKVTPLVAAVQDVLRTELAVPFRSIRSKQGMPVSTLVKEKYAICVVSPRQFTSNRPSRLTGTCKLLLRSLRAEGLVPVIIQSKPQGRDLMWVGPLAKQHRKKQAEYIQSVLPHDVFT